MRVLLNGFSTVGPKTGIGHYTEQLLAGLGGSGPGWAIDAFPRWWFRLLYSCIQGARRCCKRWLEPRAAEPEAIVPIGTAPPPPRGLLRRLARLLPVDRNAIEARFRALASSGQYDLYHEPNNVAIECALPVVLTLHDLSVLLYPQWHPPARVEHYAQAFAGGLRRAAHVLTVSHAVRAEIIRHLGIAPTRVTAVHNGVRPGLQPLPPGAARPWLHKLRLPAQYLLCVGTLEPRKNQFLLARAYARLPAAVRERFPLVLAGGHGWGTADLLAYLQGAGKVAGVRHIGFVPDAALPALYSGARALLFPSFYEGFGLPPLEMQACGGAVIASTATAVAEVLAGSPAHLLDPADEAAWCAAMLQVCTDDDWRNELRRGAVAAAARYSWGRCATETLAVYHQVVAGRGQSRLSA